MPSLRLESLELHYETRGEGTPLVFLHGLGSRATDWEPQLAEFSQHYRCVAFDLPGSGRSIDHAHPQGPFTLESYARSIAEAMRALELAPAHVVGLSMGAMTGLQLALDWPDVVRSLTMVNALASMQPRTFKDHFALGLRKLVTLTIGPRGVAKLVAPRLFPAPEHAHLRAGFVEQLSGLDPRTYAAQSRALLGWSVEARLSELRPPLTLISADGDYTPVAAKHAVAARVRGAEVVVVPNTHHALPLEAPAAFNQSLKERLTRALRSEGLG